MDSILQPVDIPSDLEKPQKRLIISTEFEASTVYNNLVQSAQHNDRMRSPGPAKDLPGFFSLVQDAITHWEERNNRSEESKVFFTEEDPDFTKSPNPAIVFSLKRRVPGAFGKGQPFESSTVNLKPVFREEMMDEDLPGYKNSIFGYYFDNEVVFTIFAKTNKVANDYAMQFETIMEEYSWFIKMNGVNQLIYMGRDKDFTLNNNGVKMYGRPISYFVRTEKLVTISQKTIEQVYIRLSVTNK